MSNQNETTDRPVLLLCVGVGLLIAGIVLGGFAHAVAVVGVCR